MECDHKYHIVWISQICYPSVRWPSENGADTHGSPLLSPPTTITHILSLSLGDKIGANTAVDISVAINSIRSALKSAVNCSDQIVTIFCFTNFKYQLLRVVLSVDQNGKKKQLKCILLSISVPCGFSTPLYVGYLILCFHRVYKRQFSITVLCVVLVFKAYSCYKGGLRSCCIASMLMLIFSEG